MSSRLGRHEPLIDPVTWATVQDILTSRRNGERSREHDHYLKGTVFCIECGRRLIVQHTRTKTGRVYDYFVCHRRRDTICPQRKALPIAQVEQRVEDLYRIIDLNPGHRERVEQIMLAKLHRQQAINGKRLDAITVEAQTVEANQDKLLEAYYADAIPRDLFLTHQRRLNADQASLVRGRAKLESENTEIRQRLCDALDLRPDFTQMRAELNEPFASITQPG